MGPRERNGRGLAALLFGVVALAGLNLACPPSKPPTQKPDAADASPVTPPASNCAAACNHANAICPGTTNICNIACGRVNTAALEACINAAGSCDALTACDKGAAMAGAGGRPAHGR